MIEHMPAPAGPEQHLQARARKPLPPEEAEAIRAAAVEALTGTFFQLLGLPISAQPHEVERAYREAAARFDPDRLASHELGDLEDVLHTLQERIETAYRVLSSDQHRLSYVGHLLAKQEATHRKNPISPAAEIELKRGEERLLMNDPRGAAEHFSAALRLNPGEPAYLARLAWATFRGAVVGSEADRARAARRLVKKALAASPNDDRLLAILGVLEAAAGDAYMARMALSQALRANENNEVARAALRRLMKA